MPPSIPAVDGPAVIVDSNGMVDVVEEKASNNGNGVPGLLDDSISSACTDELPHASGCDQTQTAGPAAEMEVLGVYKRGSVPRESDLPKDYVLKDCAMDQVMVRQRLHTRPLLDDDDADDDDDIVDTEDMAAAADSDSDSSDSDSSSDDSDADDESDGGGETKTKTKKKKKQMSQASKRERTKKSLRRRLKAQAADGTEYDVALFQPERGLVMMKRDWPFYHADLSEHSDSSDDERVYDERAILWQSIDNYEALMSNPTTSKYFLPPTIVEAEADAGAVATADAEASPSIEVDASGEPTDAATEAIELILDNPRFGEQVVVQGIAAKDIAIGDIFEVEGGHSPLRVEVSSPRLPCSYVDKRNGSAFGMKGVKRYTMTEGLAGWFTRVLVPGELRDGMHLVRTAHPHPKWTLPEISRALYGEGPKRRQMLGYPYWSRSKEELQELCNLKALGRVEWKDEAKWILDGHDSDYEKDQLKKKEEAAEMAAQAAAEKKASESQDFFSQDSLGAWVTGGLAACCGGVALATFCTPIFGQA